MEFFYNPRKAAQAAAFLVHLNGGQMDVVSLLKILYLADRKCLAQRGRPITGDRMYSMPHGPVLSRIYDQIKVRDDSPWYEYLTEREVNTVALVTEAPTDKLSDFERSILRDQFEQYHTFSFGDLKKFTHSLPEYKDLNGGSLPIDPEVILEQAGWSAEEIQEAQVNAFREKIIAEITR